MKNARNMQVRGNVTRWLIKNKADSIVRRRSKKNEYDFDVSINSFFARFRRSLSMTIFTFCDAIGDEPAAINCVIFKPMNARHTRMQDNIINNALIHSLNWFETWIEINCGARLPRNLSRIVIRSVNSAWLIKKRRKINKLIWFNVVRKSLVSLRNIAVHFNCTSLSKKDALRMQSRKEISPKISFDYAFVSSTRRRQSRRCHKRRNSFNCPNRPRLHDCS